MIFSLECLLISVASPFCFSSLHWKCQPGQLLSTLQCSETKSQTPLGDWTTTKAKLHYTSVPHFPLPSQLDTRNGHQSRADYVPPLSLPASSTTVLTFMDSAAPSLAPCSFLVVGSSSLRLSSLQDFHIVNVPCPPPGDYLTIVQCNYYSFIIYGKGGLVHSRTRTSWKGSILLFWCIIFEMRTKDFTRNNLGFQQIQYLTWEIYVFLKF